ncbi:pilus assembly protein [bacterium]|nr:MAG: pilus assembly protein [bacterium]
MTPLKYHLVRIRKNNSGSAAVEFSLVATPFIFLLFAMVEVGISMFATQVLETGTQDVGRLVMTGQSQNSATPKTQNGVTETQEQANTRVSGEFKTALCNKVSSLFSCAQIVIDVRSFSSATVVTLPNPTNCQLTNKFDMGGPDDIVVVRVFYQWPTFATFLNFSNCPDAKRLLISTAAFRNEPF